MNEQENNTPRWCVQAALVLSVMTNLLALSISTITLFWQKCGVSVAEGMVLQVIFALAIAALEVPTGLYADVKKRKLSMALGLGSLAAAEFAYGLATNFWGCVFAEVVCALAISFLSGAVEAYIYDALPEENRESEFKRIWSLRGVWIGIIAVLALPIGNWLGGIDLSLPFFTSSALLSCSFVACLFLREPPRVGAPEKVDFATMLKIARLSIVEDKGLRWLVGVGSANLLVLSVCFWLYVPVFREAGVPVTRLGAILAVFNGVFAIATWVLRKMTPKGGESRALVNGIWVAGTVALVVPFVPAGVAIGLLLLQAIVRGTSGVWLSTTTNRLANKEIRATVLSVQSLVSRLVYAVGLGVTSLFFDSWGIGAAYGLIGTITILGCVVLSRSAPANSS